MYKPKYFKAEELVDKAIFDTYGEDSLMFLDEKLLRALDKLRVFLDRPIYVNNWHMGGTLSNRGYRNPFSIVGAKLSQHKLGLACDFVVGDMNVSEVRDIILLNAHRFPAITRMEAEVPWIHIDLKKLPRGTKKIYLFKP